MKLILCCLLCLALLPASALAADAPPEHEFLTLMTFGGTQNGGDEAAFIDAQGGVYYIDLEARGLYWDGERTLEMLRSLPDNDEVAKLTADELAELRQLIDAIEIETPVQYGISSCDAGCLRLTAYRTLESGERQELPLLSAGDTIWENMDRSAVILSARLLEKMDFSRRLGRWSQLFPYGDTVPLSLRFERGSLFGGARTYALWREGDRAHFSVQGANGDDIELSAEFDDSENDLNGRGVFARLQALIEDCGIAAWDGFDARDEAILDGDGFSLRIDYGTRGVAASGYERYPEGYASASKALEAFFAELIERARAEEAVDSPQ